MEQEERDFIHGQLNKIANVTDSLRGARRGWRPQLKAAIKAALEIAVVGFVVGLPIHIGATSLRAVCIFFAVLAFLVLWKLNLLLTYETVDEMFARRDREDNKEAKERAQYFKDMGTKDMSKDE